MAYPVDLHVYSILCAAQAAYHIAELLPETDTTQELVEILDIQIDIITAMIKQEHYGTQRLREFTKHTNDILEELEKQHSE